MLLSAGGLCFSRLSPPPSLLPWLGGGPAPSRADAGLSFRPFAKYLSTAALTAAGALFSFFALPSSSEDDEEEEEEEEELSLSLPLLLLLLPLLLLPLLLPLPPFSLSSRRFSFLTGLVFSSPFPAPLLLSAVERTSSSLFLPPSCSRCMLGGRSFSLTLSPSFPRWQPLETGEDRPLSLLLVGDASFSSLLPASLLVSLVCLEFGALSVLLSLSALLSLLSFTGGGEGDEESRLFLSSLFLSFSRAVSLLLSLISGFKGGGGGGGGEGEREDDESCLAL